MRILVVDDDVDFAEMLVELLLAREHEAELATDAASAEATVRRLQPEAILIDLTLPQVSGLELGPRLRESCEGEPRLIAVTGWSDQATIDATATAGFDACLTKPVGLDEIEAALG